MTCTPVWGLLPRGVRQSTIQGTATGLLPGYGSAAGSAMKVSTLIRRFCDVAATRSAGPAQGTECAYSTRPPRCRARKRSAAA